MRPGLLALAGLLLPAVVQAATLRVPEEYGTIQAAVDVSAAGDSVLVGPGVWQGTEIVSPACTNVVALRTVVCMRPGITLKSLEGPEMTVLDAGSSSTANPTAVILYNQDGPPARVEGFTITSGRDAVGIGCSPGGLILSDCWIIDSGDNGLEVDRGSVRVEDCFVARNGGPLLGPAVYATESEVVLSDTRFESNAPGAVTAFGSTSTLHVERCEFEEHLGGRAIELQGVPVARIETSSFVRNSTSSQGGAVAVIGSGSTASIEFCTFAFDSAQSSHGGAVYVGPSTAATITNNTFYGCHAPGLGGALMVSGLVEVARNVVVACSGAAFAVSPLGEVRAAPSGCNVLWNEVNYFDWPEAAAATDLLVDPQFCDPESEDFTVAESSPCVPGNHFAHCGELIGALGSGCPPTGIVPLGFRTVPDDIAILLDGEPSPSPWIVGWPEGSVHEIGFPPSPILPTPETRYTFESWSDGGEEVHTIGDAE